MFSSTHEHTTPVSIPFSFAIDALHMCLLSSHISHFQITANGPYLCITIWRSVPQFRTQNNVILLGFSCYELKSNVKNAYSSKITICGHDLCVANKQLAKHTLQLPLICEPFMLQVIIYGLYKRNILHK